MKAGSGVKAGQAKTAARCVQVSRHDGLTAYGTAEIGPQTIGVGELVTLDAPEHWVNGLTLGQQSDGRKWRHATRTPLMPTAGSLKTTPLAYSGGNCYELVEAEWIRQERDDDIIPDYRPLVLSCYGYKPSAGNGALALEWSTDQDTVTVSAATATTLTDVTKSWTPGEWAGSHLLMRSGDGLFQDDLMEIASNTADTLTFASTLGTAPAVGDVGDVVTWATPTMYRIDNATGAAAASGVVRSFAEWQRFYAVFRPAATFNRLHVRLRSTSGTFWVDAVKLEAATPLEAGISTSATATTLTDANRGWPDDEHLGRQVVIFDGDDEGDRQAISGSDRQSITAAFAATPSATSTYAIFPASADIRPTTFVDLALVSLALQELSAYDIFAGTLLLGGGLSDAPRLVIEDAEGVTILTAGDNLDTSGFRGLRFMHGAAARFEDGYIVMCPNKGHEDSGQRIRLSYEGIEGFNTTGVRRWGLYSTSSFEFTLGTSPLQDRIVIDSDYGIAAIDVQGDTWWDVNPAAHWHFLGNEDYWLKWDDGLLSWQAVNTSLTAEGLFTAANAVITGTIYASGGTLGDLTVNGTLTMGDGGVITWASGKATITDAAMIFDISAADVPGYAFYYQVGGANRAYVYAQNEANRTLFATEVFGPADTKYGQWSVVTYEWDHGGADEDDTSVEFTVRSDTGVLFAATDSPSAVFSVTGMNVGLGATPTAKLDINSDIMRLRTAKTPASAGAAGNAGDICWDADFIYVCIAASTWRRIAHATW
ncbi:MAG: hypothetical protein H8D78_10815 [Chloroflexi bacterium]|nr:hypothetical protein [Chloroflexota bacterium]